MELESARELKAQVLADLSGPVRAAAAGPGGRPATIAVGVGLGVGSAAAGFGLAVRVSSGDALGLQVLARVVERWPDETDVRIVGAVLASTGRPDGPAPARGPLRPGVSVAHPQVTAGTLGAFVQDADGTVLLLSNNHVLADTDRARRGDAVLSPGPADGGGPQDRVATLTSWVPLAASGNALDLAFAAVDDPALVGSNVLPEGTLGPPVEDLLDGTAVAKVGRTTGHTTGVVTAVELDGVVVDYGRGDVFSFDDCVEIAGEGAAFSEGGDSGSVVYARDGLGAVGLLFAGSSTGGPVGSGLTFCNPAALALRTAGVRLL